MPEELDATQMDLTEHDDMTNRSNAPCFRRIDRLLWIFLSRWWLGWHENLVVVQPDTVSKAHETRGVRGTKSGCLSRFEKCLRLPSDILEGS